MTGTRRDMSDWRDYILQHFQQPLHQLTMVADPDGLMLEEQLLASIRQNGFDLLQFEDPVAFRFAYESRYRQNWDEGRNDELVVILRAHSARLGSLPHDLLEIGRQLCFGLPDLFPKLSYSVIKELDRALLQPVYKACSGYTGPAMGDQASAGFVLKYAFGIVPELVKSPADLLKLLLSRHSKAERVPACLDALLLGYLDDIPELASWPLRELLSDANAFYSFLQERWIGYLAAQQPTEKRARESGPTYDINQILPFGDPDIQVYVDNLFLEGKLKPISPPEGWTIEGWAQVGVEIDEQTFELQRYIGLLTHLENELPTGDATHREWMQFAVAWAELTVLHHRLASALKKEVLARPLTAS